MPQRDGEAGRRALAALRKVNANRMTGAARTGPSECPRVATLAKKRLQGCADIGILYTPNSRIDGAPNHSLALIQRTQREIHTMAKSKKSSKKSKAKKSGRKPNLAFMKPMTPSSTLAAVIGGSPMPRTEVTKKLWAYIKRNGLQDRVNRRMINADDKLRAVFGGKSQVSMFDMTKLVSNHLR
jgi:chromatin remodeling complex protein RSC6